MGKNSLAWTAIPLLLLGFLSLAKGQVVWKSWQERINETYERYGNPAKEAAEALPMLLMDDDPQQTNISDWIPILEGVYLPSTDSSIIYNEQCIHAVKYMETVFEHENLFGYLISLGEIWPYSFPDSWGVPGDGVLTGNVLPWGSLQECTRQVVEPTIPIIGASFTGKYCLINVRNKTSQGNIVRSSIEDIDRTKVIWDIKTSPDYYFYGTCIPSSCTEGNMMESVEHTFNSTGWEVVDVKCQTAEDPGVLTPSDKSFIAIVSIIWFLIVGAGCVDLSINLFKKQNLRKGPLKYLLALSAYSNMQKIFRIVNKSNPEVINCLHGMRALSMIWVTWCHSYLLFSKVTLNLKGLQVIASQVVDQIIVNGSFSADTFFFMSGLLAAYSVLREKALTGKVNWVMYYIHRLLRLMPAIALTCYFMATMARHALVGPYGPYVVQENLEPCRNYWFMDVLFASNFAGGDNYRCLPQSWYTSVDTQLYIILPLVLLPLVMKPKLGLFILTLFTLASFAIPTSLFAVYDLKPYLPFAKPEVMPTDTTLNNYMMPWNRASPYFIGVWAGWLLFTYRDKKVNMPWFVAVIGWAVSAAVASFILFGIAPYNVFENPKELPSSIRIAYGGLSRGLWALALVWVVFACQKGYGGLMNSVLSHSTWQPLSRLAFSMYLITVPVQIMSTGASFMTFYMNHLNKFIETCGYLFISGLLAIGVAITSELPFLSLEKAINPRPGRNIQEEPPKES